MRNDLKPYEKPRLTAISLSGNERLCGSCSGAGGTAVKNDPGLSFLLNIVADKNGDGQLSKQEVEAVFGLSEASCSIRLNSYCKFSAADPQLLAYS